MKNTGFIVLLCILSSFVSATGFHKKFGQYLGYNGTNVTLVITFLPGASNPDRLSVIRKDRKDSTSFITENTLEPAGSHLLGNNQFAELFLDLNGGDSNYQQVANWPHVFQVAEQAAKGDGTISPFYLNPVDPVFRGFARAGAFRLSETRPAATYNNGKSYKKVVFSSENKSRIIIILEKVGDEYTVSGFLLKWSGIENIENQAAYLDESLEANFKGRFKKPDDNNDPGPGSPGSGASVVVSSAMLPYQAEHDSELLPMKHWIAPSLLKVSKSSAQAKYASGLLPIKHWIVLNLKVSKFGF